MKAIALTRYLPISNPESLIDIELDKPVPTGRDLLVKIEAIAVNPVDTKVRAPKDTVEKTPRVLGWDAAGIVEAAGPDATLFKPGDAVYYAGSITRPGANSEFHLVDERIVGAKPKSLDFTCAAALPLTTITAWEALFERLGVSPEGADEGKSVLIVGGAGGVGSIGIQLAKKRREADRDRDRVAPGIGEMGDGAGRGPHRQPFRRHPAATESDRPRASRLRADLQRLRQAFPGRRRGHQAAGPYLFDRGKQRAARHRAPEGEERRVSLGVHVHAFDVRHAGHDRAAQAACRKWRG